MIFLLTGKTAKNKSWLQKLVTVLVFGCRSNMNDLLFTQANSKTIRDYLSFKDMKLIEYV